MIEFTKLHGNGNDFILIDEYFKSKIPESKKKDFAAEYCDRRFGIGGDGVLYLEKSDKADLKMRILQPDKSEAEMCGNGIRCLVKYAIDKGYVDIGTISVETKAGVLPIKTRRDYTGKIWIKVNLGIPITNRKDIPMIGEGDPIEELYGYRVYAVNTGVPHSVIFTEDLDNLDILNIAPKIRYNSIFPNGTNVNFVEIKNKELYIRTYERGVEEETMSCGTGSVASAFIALFKKQNKKVQSEKIKVNTKGGVLYISFENGFAFMEGSAKTVYEGVLGIRY